MTPREILDKWLENGGDPEYRKDLTELITTAMAAQREADALTVLALGNGSFWIDDDGARWLSATDVLAAIRAGAQ